MHKRIRKLLCMRDKGVAFRTNRHLRHVTNMNQGALNLIRSQNNACLWQTGRV